MRNSCHTCPFGDGDGWTQEAEEAIGLGCLPSMGEAINIKRQTNCNWGCHSENKIWVLRKIRLKGALHSDLLRTEYWVEGDLAVDGWADRKGLIERAQGRSALPSTQRCDGGVNKALRLLQPHQNAAIAHVSVLIVPAVSPHADRDQKLRGMLPTPLSHGAVLVHLDDALVIPEGSDGRLCGAAGLTTQAAMCAARAHT